MAQNWGDENVANILKSLFPTFCRWLIFKPKKWGNKYGITYREPFL